MGKFFLEEWKDLGGVRKYHKKNNMISSGTKFATPFCEGQETLKGIGERRKGK